MTTYRHHSTLLPVEPITMTYRNWRGEVAERRVVPTSVWYGSTEWHKEPGWFLKARDIDKGEERDFALADCQFADLGDQIIEARGADAEPARPTPFPASYDDLVFDPITGWSQTVVVDGERPEWLRDDDRCCESIRRASFRWRGSSRFSDVLAIRVRRREPKRETVSGLFVQKGGSRRFPLSFDLIDGKPDLSTLKIAEDAL